MISDHPLMPIALKTSDAVFAAMALATLARILPALAALLSCIWYLIRIGEWAAKRLRGWAAPDPAGDD